MNAHRRGRTPLAGGQRDGRGKVLPYSALLRRRLRRATEGPVLRSPERQRGAKEDGQAGRRSFEPSQGLLVPLLSPFPKPEQARSLTVPGIMADATWLSNPGIPLGRLFPHTSGDSPGGDPELVNLVSLKTDLLANSLVGGFGQAFINNTAVMHEAIARS